MAQNVFLPRGAAFEMVKFLEQYAAERSLDSPLLLSALESGYDSRSRPLLGGGSTFAGGMPNLGLIAGELSKYTGAGPITRVLDGLQRKTGIASLSESEFKMRGATFHFARALLEATRPHKQVANLVDAANLEEAAALLTALGSRLDTSGPPVLISSSRALHAVGGKLGESLSQDLEGYPLVGDPVDLILIHTIIQREPENQALSTLIELRESLLPTEAVLAEVIKQGQDHEQQSHHEAFERQAASDSFNQFRRLWRSINSKTLLDGAEMEIAFSAQLVEMGTSTREGRLVVAVSVVWDEILRELEHNPRILFEFSKAPEKFEELVAGAYKKHGWDCVELTPRSGDGGRDVIATKVGFGAVRFLDQVKAYSPGHLVTHEEVRAMVGVLALDQNASKALITTTSDFAPGVLNSGEFRGLMPNRLELKNGHQLHKWLIEAHSGRQI